MHIIHRKTCRVCGSPALKKVIDLGEQHLQGSFVKPGKENPPLRRIPMELVRCDPTADEGACGLLQMAHSVPPEILYSAYWYRSGTNRTMREHLRGIAEEARQLTGKESGWTLDIGCNDGVLLHCYPGSWVKYGIDPSDITGEITGDIKVIQSLFPSERLLAEIGEQRFDVVTSIAMFYDLESPVEFVHQVKRVLAPDGVWIFEMSYMPTMLAQNSYDTICHEHLEYYSLAVIERILGQTGMKLVRATLNDINGGSIRCVATHADNFSYDRPEDLRDLSILRQQEFDIELDTDRPYRDFQSRIDLHREQLTRLIKDLKREGKRIHIYGASTKGNTILQWCNLDFTLIDFAAERNPDKYGAHTLGTNIRIISEAESRAMKPDFYLVLPWHFRDEIIERERETMAAGTQLIFPLPEIEIIGK